MDIISTYQQVGSYRGTAAVCGTTAKTVKRVIVRAEAGGTGSPRVRRVRNFESVAGLVAAKIISSSGRFRWRLSSGACRLVTQLDPVGAERLPSPGSTTSWCGACSRLLPGVGGGAWLWRGPRCHALPDASTHEYLQAQHAPGHRWIQADRQPPLRCAPQAVTATVDQSLTPGPVPLCTADPSHSHVHQFFVELASGVRTFSAPPAPVGGGPRGEGGRRPGGTVLCRRMPSG